MERVLMQGIARQALKLKRELSTEHAEIQAAKISKVFGGK